MRKPAFCICENKRTDQQCGNRAAIQRLCFFRKNVVQFLFFSKSEISRLQSCSVVVQPDMVEPWSETSNTGFLMTRLLLQMCRIVRKPAFCVCENKDADQLRGNREADQRLCFRYIDSTIPLLPKYEISSFKRFCVAV